MNCPDETVALQVCDEASVVPWVQVVTEENVTFAAARDGQKTSAATTRAAARERRRLMRPYGVGVRVGCGPAV